MALSRRLTPLTVAVVVLAATAGFVATAPPAAACSLFTDRIDLDAPTSPSLGEAIAGSDRLVRVEVLAHTPPARDFTTGGLVEGTAQWPLDALPAPLVMILDDGRDLTHEHHGCWLGYDVGDIGETMVLGLRDDVVVWTFVGDDQLLVDRLGSPTALPRDPDAVEELRGALADRRPLAARISHHLPLGLWSPLLAAVGVALAIGSRRRKPSPASGLAGSSSSGDRRVP